MNSHIPFNRINKLFIIMLAVCMCILSSCDKKADAALIKVSSVALSGTTGGSGPIVGSGNVSYVVNGSTYTMSTPANTVIFSVYKDPGTNAIATTIVGSIPGSTTRGCSISSNSSAVGEYDIYSYLAFVDSKSYSGGSGTGSNEGKIKYSKFEYDSRTGKGAVQGTYEINTLDQKGDPFKVTGAFDITM
jgi:hypothetical protein